MSEQAGSVDLGGQGVFVRRSSGLTRQVSALDALIFGSVGPGITVGLVFILWTAWLYPGMNYPLAILTVVFMFPISALYWIFSVAMPRSGGEYIYVSRSLHPAIGLMCSFIVSISMANATGNVTNWVTTYGIADGFAAVGIASGAGWANGIADFLWSQPGRTIVGTVSIIVFTWIWLRGTKATLRASWAGMISALVLLVVLAIIVIAGGGQSGFVDKWNAMSGTNYQQLLDYASQNGYLVPFTFIATLMGGLTYVCENTTGATFTANIAGEVRGVQKSQMVALFGALIVSMITWYIAAQLVYSAIGGEFNAALNTMLLNGSDQYPAILAGREPFIGLMIAFFTDNPIVLIGVGIIIGITLWTALIPLGFASIRNVFAWSFDRVLPAKFAELDHKRQQPWLTCLVYGAACELMLILYIWAPQVLGFVAFFIFLWFIGWIFLGISGVVFPYTRRGIYENAPPVVRAKFLGIPVIQILGVLTIIISVAVEWFMAIPVLAGTTSWMTLVTVAIFLAVPFIIYYVSKAVRAKSAVPLDMQFTQIPPD
jgi:amino acid transporter